MLTWEGLSVCGAISREYPLYSCFCRDPKKMEKVLAEKNVTKEELQGEWTLPTRGLKVCR